MTSATLEHPLFRTRSLASSLELGCLQAVFPGSKPLDRIYLLAPAAQGGQLARQYGIEHDRNGAYFACDAEVDLRRLPETLLPFFARPRLTPFLSDLPPANAWGGSLAALIIASSLQPLAEASSQRFGHKCYMCGAPSSGTQKSPSHPARAWWRYHEPRDGERHARQHLLAFTPMCRDCSDMWSLPAGDAERLRKSLARIACAFRFTEAEAREYLDLVRERWQRHSGFLWAVDGSRVFGRAEVAIQAAWQHRADSLS